MRLRGLAFLPVAVWFGCSAPEAARAPDPVPEATQAEAPKRPRPAPYATDEASTFPWQSSGPFSPFKAGSPPSAVPIPSSDPPGASSAKVIGFVLDAAFRAVNGASVEVLDGPQTGTSQAAGDGKIFTIFGTLDAATRFRATAAGYVTSTKTWVSAAPGGVPYVPFYLEAAAPPVTLASNYVVSFTADAACSTLPVVARTRIYSGNVVQVGSTVDVNLGGATFTSSLDGFAIGVADHTLGFWLYGTHNAAIAEEIAPNTYVAYSGNASATIASGASAISTAFEGWIEYCVNPAVKTSSTFDCGASNPTRVHCDSMNHQLTMTPF